MGSGASEWSSKLSGNEVELLLSWYASQGRQLPWRETNDPYRIWVTETLLQQTRIRQAEARIHRFLERFPTLQALAESLVEAVLQIWQGLGYYQRAHNLHRAAQQLYQRGGFAALKGLADLGRLPGVGPYTARAIWSFSGRGAALPIDGNLVRVLSRYFADETPANQRSRFQAQADALPLYWQRREVAFALMDLAQLVCTPKRPRCLLCPLQQSCNALQLGAPERFPIRSPKSPKPTRYFQLLWYANAEAVWLEQRPSRGLWGGLWSPPLQEVAEPRPQPPDLQHELTHFRLVGYLIPTSEPPLATFPIRWEELSQYQLPAPIRQLLTHKAEGRRGLPSPEHRHINP